LRAVPYGAVGDEQDESPKNLELRRDGPTTRATLIGADGQLTLRDDYATGPATLNVTLNQAIEIHAKALRRRFGDRAPLLAREKANYCSTRGDHEGHAVWLEVADVAKTFAGVTNPQQQSRQGA
jgi:hypothetical protein